MNPFANSQTVCTLQHLCLDVVTSNEELLDTLPFNATISFTDRGCSMWMLPSVDTSLWIFIPMEPFDDNVALIFNGDSFGCVLKMEALWNDEGFFLAWESSI